MSGRSARVRRFTSVVAVIAGVSVGTLAATSAMTGATTSPTTTIATTSPTTTVAPTTPTNAAPSTVPPTTYPGPTPRPSTRVASPVDIEKIRATSLPFRTMGIAVGVTVALLAVAGFIYGKVRSGLPAVKAPKLAVAGPAPMAGQSEAPAPRTATPLPPPTMIPLPPPAVEDAVSDTVIFEPPPTHHAPEVIAQPEPDANDDAEPAEVVDADSGETVTSSSDEDPDPEAAPPPPEPETPDRD